MLSKIHEEDFILTIPDDYTDSADSDIAPVPETKKRKREAIKPVPAGKKRKVQHVQQPMQDNDVTSEDEPDEQDGAFDPQFEFDIGTNYLGDDVEDFDGWGDGAATTEVKGRKVAVDIDNIIARRLAQQDSGDAPGLHASESVKSDSAASDGEGLQSGPEMAELDEDELLATDTFGGDVATDEEEEEVDEKSHDGSESDSESIASPTAHPDDVDSEQSDAERSSRTSPSDDENEDEIAKRAAFFAPESHSDKEPGSISFQKFSLSRPILRALTSLSFSKPTPIQARAIPVALQGLDIVGSAVTGSGKTAAFLLPILERLLYRPRKIPTTRVAILMPTRELAVQCYNVAVALSRYTDITFAQVVGGFSLREQESILKRRPDVVIATPGRFIDHMRNSASFTVENIEILVLDEADRMLEDGFADELDEILKTIPKGRQTMLFSATMTESVDKLVRVGMNLPVRISVDAKKSTVSGLVQEFVRLRPGREQMRLATLAILCTKYFKERTIVFFRQKKEAHRIRVVFGLLGLKAGELHGNMSQEQRIAAVNSFRDGKITHLLATDVASRGLDIKNVMSVVNYEAPQSYEIYLHRVGRTARAGRSGQSCTIAAEPDRKVVKAAVKSARSQGAKIVSRIIETSEADTMHERIENLADDIEEILNEEKQEKALAQTETQITRGENLVRHQEEIMSRPKRTWFESEKDKQAAKERGKAELNDGSAHGVKFVGEKKKLSNKDKKKLDDRKLRTEGRLWKKGRGDADTASQHAKSKKGGSKQAAQKGKKGRK